LRSLGLTNIDYVDLNIADTICNESGVLSYEWHDNRCFSIMNDQVAEQYFPLTEFGIVSLNPSTTYYDMILGLGVDDNYISACDSKDNFDAIEKKIERRLLSPGHPRFILLDGGYDDNIDPEDDFYAYINNGCAGIMVKAEYEDLNLIGLNVTVANKSNGKASAYIKEAEVSTDESCLICCKSDVFLYDYDLECRWGSEVSLTECDNEHCAHYRDSPDDCYTANGGGGLMEEMCKGVSARCDGACQWSPGNLSTDPYRCYGG